MTGTSRLILTALALWLTALPAFAQTKVQPQPTSGVVPICEHGPVVLYRYVDSDGRIHYSERPLTDSAGRTIKCLHPDGTQVPTKPDNAAPFGNTQISAEERRLRKEQLDKDRRDFALLDTYHSMKEIDEAQASALREPKRELEDVQARMIDAGRRRTQLQAQVDGYPGDSAPAEVRRKLSGTQIEFQSLAALVETKVSEIKLLNERYDEDRRRYTQLLEKAQIIHTVGGGTGAKPAR